MASLIYLCPTTRPDLSYAVNVLSRYMDKFDRRYWNAAKRMLQYLKRTVNFEIAFKSSGSFVLNGYCDSDSVGDRQTRKSTSGYVFQICNGPVSRCAQRQSIVTLSSTEAEYVATSTAAREAVWLRQLLKDIGHPCASATMLNIDNQSAMQIIKNPTFHRRTKHIDVQHHFIREKYECGVINVQYIDTKSQLADIFTKALAREPFEYLFKQIGMFCMCDE